MIHVITSNPLDIRSIKFYADDFVICDTYQKTMPPMMVPVYQIDVYYHEDLDPVIFEDYEDEPDIRYMFKPVPSIIHALEDIAEKLEPTEKQSEDTDEHMLAVACGYDWNQQICKRLNLSLKDAESKTRALNIYTAMKMTSQDKLVQFIKSVLGSENVFPDDPIAFGYALHVSLNGGGRI